jgi:hypothetical protein
MPKYTVSAYPIVQVELRSVEADSQEEAIEKAIASVNFTGLFRSARTADVSVGSVEWCEDFEQFLVDEEGDSDYVKSKWYTGDKRVQDESRRIVIGNFCLELTCNDPLVLTIDVARRGLELIETREMTDGHVHVVMKLPEP